MSNTQSLWLPRPATRTRISQGKLHALHLELSTVSRDGHRDMELPGTGVPGCPACPWGWMGSWLCRAPALALLNRTGLRKRASSLAHRLRETGQLKDEYVHVWATRVLPRCGPPNAFVLRGCFSLHNESPSFTVTGFCFVLWTARASCQRWGDSW